MYHQVAGWLIGQFCRIVRFLTKMNHVLVFLRCKKLPIPQKTQLAAVALRASTSASPSDSSVAGGAFQLKAPLPA